MALLDIIITHYNEKWSDGRKMFEMLRLQRGVDWNDVRVILVQDGPEDSLDMMRISRVYPFVQLILELPHGGVSRARNAGLEAADAKWVMFCDFDDCLYSVDSLNRILESLRQAGDDADLVWSDIWIEMREPTGRWYKRRKGMNAIFIHGKCYRREFLISRGIRFDPELDYSEDALFNAIFMMETKRSARMPEVTYMWCNREESLSNYTGGDARRNESLFAKRIKLCEAFEERGLKYDAKAAAARAELEYYWEICGKGECAGHSNEEWIRMVQEQLIARWPNAIAEISDADRQTLMKITRTEAAKKGFLREDMPDPEEWLRGIGAIG